LTGQEGINDAMLISIISNYQEGGAVKQLASFYTQCMAAGTLSLGGSTCSLVGIGAFFWGLSFDLQQFFCGSKVHQRMKLVLRKLRRNS